MSYPYRWTCNACDAVHWYQAKACGNCKATKFTKTATGTTKKRKKRKQRDSTKLDVSVTPDKLSGDVDDLIDNILGD